MDINQPCVFNLLKVIRVLIVLELCDNQSPFFGLLNFLDLPSGLPNEGILDTDVLLVWVSD
jgi:hypothetical protein